MITIQALAAKYGIQDDCGAFGNCLLFCGCMYCMVIQVRGSLFARARRFILS